MKTLLAALSILLLAACGTSEPTSATASVEDGEQPADVDVEPGTFKMFVSPGGAGDSRCAFYTELSFFNGFQAPVAQLENGLQGTCDVLVDPDRRVYNLGVSVDACNTKHLVSEGLEILDHRHRTCKDIVQAKIIMTQSDEQGFTTRLYSDDHPATVQARTEQGILTSVQAIGGETTGYGLKLANGDMLELDLATNGFENQFVEDVKIDVTGTMKTVKGVEIPIRKVLVVTSMTSLAL